MKGFASSSRVIYLNKTLRKENYRKYMHIDIYIYIFIFY